MRVCADCGRPLRVKRPGEPGPQPTYCDGTCRKRAWRRAHPLGWRVLRAAGIEDRSLLDELERSGVDTS